MASSQDGFDPVAFASGPTTKATDFDPVAFASGGVPASVPAPAETPDISLSWNTSFDPVSFATEKPKSTTNPNASPRDFFGAASRSAPISLETAVKGTLEFPQAVVNDPLGDLAKATGVRIPQVPQAPQAPEEPGVNLTTTIPKPPLIQTIDNAIARHTQELEAFKQANPGPWTEAGSAVGSAVGSLPVIGLVGSGMEGLNPAAQWAAISGITTPDNRLRAMLSGAITGSFLGPISKYPGVEKAGDLLSPVKLVQQGAKQTMQAAAFALGSLATGGTPQEALTAAGTGALFPIGVNEHQIPNDFTKWATDNFSRVGGKFEDNKGKVFTAEELQSQYVEHLLPQVKAVLKNVPEDLSPQGKKMLEELTVVRDSHVSNELVPTQRPTETPSLADVPAEDRKISPPGGLANLTDADLFGLVALHEAVQETQALRSGMTLPEWQAQHPMTVKGVSRISSKLRDALYQTSDAPSPMWYSQMRNALERDLPGKSSAVGYEQLFKTYQEKGKYKASELDESGLQDWIAGQKGTLTKQDVLDHLDQNAIKVKEVIRGGNADKANEAALIYTDQLREKYGQQDPNVSYDELLRRATPEERAKQQELDRAIPHSATFGDVTLPGGENYRELLLTLPSRGYSDPEIPELDAPGDYTGGHFNEPNVLAHIRFDDRVDAEGKRTLFVNEVQSDWHQGGREFGYASPDKMELSRQVSEITSRPSETWTPEEARLVDLEEEQGVGVIPNAPFKKNWHELATKRMLKYAVDDGYDKIAFPATPEQVAQIEGWGRLTKVGDKYYIGQAVDPYRASYEETSPGTWLVKFPNEEHVIEVKAASKQEAAQKINQELNEGPNAPVRNMTSIINRYLQDIPRFLNGYVKKWGGRVETTIVKTDLKYPNEGRYAYIDPITGERSNAEGAHRIDNPRLGLRNKETVQSLTITNAMRTALKSEPQPLYQQAQAKVKGALTLKQNGKSIMRLTQAADTSTILHEWAHSYLHLMDDDLRAGLREFLGGTENTRAAHEKFARSFERYVHDGVAPKPILQTTFDRLSTLMRTVYKKFTGSEIDLQLSPAFHETMAKLLDFETPAERLARTRLFLEGNLYTPEGKQAGISAWLKGDILKNILTPGKMLEKESKGLAEYHPVEQSEKIVSGLEIAKDRAEQHMRLVDLSLTESQKADVNRVLEYMKNGELDKLMAFHDRGGKDIVTVARTLRQNYDAMRALKIQDIKDQVMFANSIHEDEISRVLAGETPEGVYPTPVNKDGTLRKVSKALEDRREAVQAAVDAINEANDWGKEGYFTHAQIGTRHFVDENGYVVATGLTEKHATQRALAYLKDWVEKNPGVPPTLKYVDNLYTEDGPALEMNKRAFYANMGRLAKVVDADFSTIAAAVRKQFNVKLELSRPSSPYLRKSAEVGLASEDPIAAHAHYLYSFNKALELGKVLRQLNKDMPNYSKEAQKILTSQFEFARGHYSWEDKVVDGIFEALNGSLKKVGGQGIDVAPGFLSREVVPRATAFETFFKLTSRPIWSMINFYSDMSKLQAERKIGVLHSKYGPLNNEAGTMAKALAFMTTDEGKQFLKEELPHIPSFYQPDALGDLAPRRSASQFLLKYFPLSWVSRTLSRFGMETALAANYLYAKANPDKVFFGRDVRRVQETDYREFARRSARVQVSAFASVARGAAWRGPAAKLGLQFKHFVVSETQFIHSTSSQPNVLFRYMLPLWAMGGAKALLTTLASFTAWFGAPQLRAINQKFEESENPLMQAAYRGLPAFFGSDISAPLSYRFPTPRWQDWVPPFVSDIAGAMEVVGNGMRSLDAWQFAQEHAPLVYAMRQIYDNLQFGEHGFTRVDNPTIRDSKGNAVTTAEAADLWKELLGVTPMKASQERSLQAFLAQDAQKRAEEKNYLKRAIAQGALAGKDVSDYMMRGRVLGLTQGDIAAGIMTATLSPSLRLQASRNIQAKLYLLPMAQAIGSDQESAAQPGTLP